MSCFSKWVRILPKISKSPKTGTNVGLSFLGTPSIKDTIKRNRKMVDSSGSLIEGSVDTLEECRFIVCGVKELPALDGGVERGVENLGRRLVEKGIYVEVLARGCEKTISTHLGINLVSLPYMPNKYLCYFTYMFRAVGVIRRKKHNRTIICVHSPSVNGGWVPILKFLGYTVVIHSHGLEWRAEKWPQWFRPVMRLLERVAVKTADAIICVAKHEIQYYRQYRNKLQERILLIPNGLPLIAPSNGHNILEKFGLNAGEYFLTIGRLVPQKRFDDLIEAHRLASTNRQLVVVGGPSFSFSYENELRHLARENGQVIFTGELPHSDVQTLLSQSYAFLSASAHEGCPNALLEAAARGVALLVSDIAAHREICGEQALMFKVGHVKQLSQMIRKIDADSAVYYQAKLTAIKIMQDWPSWDEVAGAWIDLFLDLQKEEERYGR